MVRSMDMTNAHHNNNNSNMLRQAQKLYQQTAKKKTEKSVERRTANGNYVASIYPDQLMLGRPRYINEKIELELIDFKKEIKDKFSRS